MCLRHAKKDLYHIALSVAKHIAFYEIKYIAHTKCVYRERNSECGIRIKKAQPLALCKRLDFLERENEMLSI